MIQENLRKNCKLAKALNDDIFTYKDFAEAIDIDHNSFYNWLNGAYNLSDTKAKSLNDFINNILY